MQQNWRRLRVVVAGGLLTLLAALVALPGSRAAAGQTRRDGSSPSLGQCKRSLLTRPPLWTGSGAWNGEDLVLVDTIRRSLLPFSPEGRAKPEPRGPLQKALTDLYPIRIAAGSGDRLVVQADANRFLVLDRGYATLDNVSTRLLPGRDGSTIEKIFDWTLAGDDILGFADVKFSEAQWGTGIVRFSTKPLDKKTLGTNSGFQFFHNFEMSHPSRLYHRLGYTYTTSLGGTAYYLLMGNGIHLWRQVPGAEPQDLGDLEGSFPLWQSSPQLPRFMSPQDYPEVMAVVEKSSMPTGLYGWTDPVSGQRALYLVSRQWQNGETQWLLSKLRFDKNNRVRVLEQSRIVSNANHLFVVPGPSQWVVVEKGPAQGLQEQVVKNIFTIPVEKIRKGLQPVQAAGRIETKLLDICQ